MKLIPLSRKMHAKVDDEDYERLSQWRWHYRERALGESGYAVRIENGKTIRMHRYLNKTEEGMLCDHKDGDTLNNQKSNLRNCTHAQNSMNRVRSGGVSAYKGVYLYKGKWIGIIRIGSRSFSHVGKSEQDCARFYDQKAKEIFGEYARLNFPETE